MTNDMNKNIKEKISIRPAGIEDIPFVAKGVLMALHIDDLTELPQVEAVCKQEDTLYAWQNALLACFEDKPVGLCLAYEGTNYHEKRIRTFEQIESWRETMDMSHMEDETGPGEYYIDSLAVLPEFRGLGIGSQLIQAQLEKGRASGLKVATLLVDPNNPPAIGLYIRNGFKDMCDVYAFGQIYRKMRAEL